MAVAGFADLDFHDFHRRELPRRIAAGHGALAAPVLADLPSLALRLPGGDAYTYAPAPDGPDGVAIAPGDDAEVVAELEHEAWEGLVHDYESAPGLLYSGRVRFARGHGLQLVAWEPALRALFAGRPVFDPQAPLLGRDGEPVDPAHAFGPDDDVAAMAEFLRSTGYCFVRGLFSRDEVAGFLDEARALRGEAVEGDKLSWWTHDVHGRKLVCRVTRAADKPRLATLRADPRLHRLAALSEEPLAPSLGEGNGVTVIFKSPDVREGLSDLPWHRDCGMGGHSILCPVLIASVYLTPATSETGELRFLPGSWRATAAFREATDPGGPQGVAFAAEPGDVSIHYGDVMHAAPPPTRSDLSEYRVSATTGFSRPGAHNHRGESSYNAALHRREDGQIEHLAKVAGRS